MEKKSKKTIWKWVIGAAAIVVLLGIVFIWQLNKDEPDVKPQEDEELVITVEDEEPEENPDLVNATMQTAKQDPYHGPIVPLAVYKREKLPRIVCWGDSLTEQSGFSYPEVLKEKTEAKIANYGKKSDSTWEIASRARDSVAVQGKEKDDVVILFSGANDGIDEPEDAQDLIRRQQSLLEMIGARQYIVISLTYADEMDAVAKVNEAMQEAYGEHFLNFTDYCVRFGLEDAGIKPTKEDKEDIANGYIPTSLRVDHVHGTQEYYALLAEQVYRKLMFLGYLPLDESYSVEAYDNKIRVVFWGDSITECTGGNGVTFPKVVKELAAEDGKDIEVRNYGVYAERSSLIAARAGGNPMRLNSSVTIPADTTPVEIVPVSDMFGYEMLLVFGGDRELSARPEFDGDNSINPCIIAGVEGNISMNAKENKRYFTRLEPGEPVEAKEGELIEFWAMRDKRPSDILVIWSGTNDELTPEKCDETFQYIHSIIDYTGTDKYIVINMQKIEEMPQIDAINERFAEEFGEHCLDIYSYLLNDAMDEAGLTPTAEDEQMLKERRMPMSLRSDMSGHFNEVGYTMIGHEIYRKLRELGYL